MTGDRWKLVEDLFSRAADLPGTERRVLLDRECGDDATLRAEVETLLAGDAQAQGFVGNNVAAGLKEFDESQERAMVRRAGPYRLTKELGRGGMGTVYLGQRDDGEYEGEVAVKLVRPGLDTDFFMMRFKRERQALARLQHTNIARLLDSGATADGEPYIVMELVDGKPVNAFCREQGLGVAAILRLFIDICAAVSHAHRHFVVHRDLKPGNILVKADGTPKLLDFGICKMLIGGAEAEATAQMMTPDYASPEQVRGDPITIASDIYSLGAVLYELLTGAKPHKIDQYSPQALVKAVCEDEVIRPSLAARGAGLGRQLSGDLDTILLKVLQKDPGRRYDSVEQFAEDLGRVLRDEPVKARPDTAFYRTGKFVRRHRIGVAAAAVVAFLLTGAAIGYARKAEVARKQSAEARALANAMMFEIYDEVRELPGALKAHENIVKRGLGYLDRMSAEAGDDQELRQELASAYLRMGDVQGSSLKSNKGDSDGAMASYRKGLAALGDDQIREARVLRMEFHHRIGHAFEKRSVQRATEEFDQGITIGAELRHQFPGDRKIIGVLSDLYSAKSLALRTAQRREESLAAARQSISLQKEILAAEPESREARAAIAGTTSTAATALRALGRLGEARKMMEESVAQWEELCHLEPVNFTFQRNRMLAYSHLGDVLGNPSFENLGDTAGARAAFGAMLESARRLHQSGPGNQRALIDYGMALSRVAALPIGPLDERLERATLAVQKLGEASRKDPGNMDVVSNLGSVKATVGDLHAAAGRMDEARMMYRSGAADCLRTGPALPSATGTAVTILRKLAADASERGLTAEAAAHARTAVDAAEAGLKEHNTVSAKTVRARAYDSAAMVMSKAGRTAEARRSWEIALEDLRSVSGDKEFSPKLKELMGRIESSLRQEASR